MALDELRSGLKERLDDFIKLAQSGGKVQLEIKAYTSMVKQLGRSESTDDIDIEVDMNLLMADFVPAPVADVKPGIVTKVYAVCPINESEIDANTTRHIANQRLRMDYARLKEVGVRFEEKYF